MEHLSKQQIILLTLLVSFVTSIATGVVAVSLMDQASQGVTQTINHIVERTIEKAVSVEASAQNAAVVQSEPKLEQVVEKISKSIVYIKPKNSGTDAALGTGIVLSKEGIIVTDKSIMDAADRVAVFSDGNEFPLQVIQSQIIGDIVFVAAIVPRDYIFYPAVSSSNLESIKLGKSVFAFAGKQADILQEGLMSKMRSRPDELIETTLSGKNLAVGNSLFTKDGIIVGIKTASLPENTFYPLDILKATMPNVTR